MTKENEEKSLFPDMERSIAELQTKPNRRKFFRIEDRIILETALALAHGRASHQIRGLPADVEILGVYYDPGWRAFTFQACSMKWPVGQSGKYVEEVIIEIIPAPQGSEQWVLWRQLTSRLLHEQEPLRVEDAAKIVTSEGWKDGTTKIGQQGNEQ